MRYLSHACFFVLYININGIFKYLFYQTAVLFVFVIIRKLFKTLDHAFVIPALHILIFHIKALPQIVSQKLVVSGQRTDVGKLVPKGNDFGRTFGAVF